MQLDSQQDRQQIGSIDTDSQKDSQQENPDVEPVATVETVYTVEAAIEKVEAVTDTVETAIDTVESVTIDEPDKGAIGPVPDDSDPIEPGKGEGMNAAQAFRYVTKKGVKVSEKTLSNWVKLKEIPITDKGDNVSEYLILRDKLYYPIN
jgi:hypothetical protein